MRAYLLAFWHGTTTGPAEWLGWLGLLLIGAAIALALVGFIGWVCDYLARHEDKPTPPEHFCANEPRLPQGVSHEV